MVVDEVHTYRGVMGSHVAQIFRRFHRICRCYGASPTFVFSSATVADPGHLAQQLTGLAVTAVTKSGAPRKNRSLVFINPETGPAQAAILLLKAALYTIQKKTGSSISWKIKSLGLSSVCRDLIWL
ncbi:MAG: hypothetical protein JRF17_11030 [Deltaproteobacteria bacterium]|nr:hypothetical protein [Deltaproteobacteria bacterium]